MEEKKLIQVIKKNSLLGLVILLGILFLSFCTITKKNTTSIANPENMNTQIHFIPDSSFAKEFDSVSFFRDIDLGYLKGIEKLNEKNLTYPFVSLKYKNDNIELYSFLSKEKVKKWIIKKGKIYYSTFSYKDPREGQIEHITMLLPMKGEVIFLHTLGNSFDPNTSTIGPHLIIYQREESPNKVNISSYRYFQDKISLSIGDIIDRLHLEENYLEYSEDELQISDHKLWSIRSLFKDLRTGKTSRSQKKKITIPNFLYPSFFYYQIHDQIGYYQNGD
ncbi:MAG: hypothetical protein QM687_11775 [Ferruginibacter sp.]